MFVDEHLPSFICHSVIIFRAHPTWEKVPFGSLARSRKNTLLIVQTWMVYFRCCSRFLCGRWHDSSIPWRNTKGLISTTSAASALTVFISCARISDVVNIAINPISSIIWILKESLRKGARYCYPLDLRRVVLACYKCHGWTPFNCAADFVTRLPGHL